MKLAPIVLFVYNRLEHSRRTIEALQKNSLSKESELYIYSDASKNSKTDKSVQDVRDFIRNIHGFKKINIIEQKENLGLSLSIISGVTDILNKYDKVIVMEDDLVTSPYFLKFMNDALDRYRDVKDIWHISGWNYPFQFNPSQDTYVYRIMNCWGWATWSDRWEHFEKNTDNLIIKFTKKDIMRFNLDGYTDLWRQVKQNKSGLINTWAIFWYASIFQKNGLCLNPGKSFVRNIGHDGSGIHCNISEYNDNEKFNENEDLLFVQKIKEDENIINQVKQYFKKTKKLLITRIYNKIKTNLIGYFR
jgi:hypothetical protein